MIDKRDGVRRVPGPPRWGSGAGERQIRGVGREVGVGGGGRCPARRRRRLLPRPPRFPQGGRLARPAGQHIHDLRSLGTRPAGPAPPMRGRARRRGAAKTELPPPPPHAPPAALSPFARGEGARAPARPALGHGKVHERGLGARGWRVHGRIHSPLPPTTTLSACTNHAPATTTDDDRARGAAAEGRVCEWG